MDMIKQLIDMGFDKEWLQKFLEKSFEYLQTSSTAIQQIDGSKEEEQ